MRDGNAGMPGLGASAGSSTITQERPAIGLRGGFATHTGNVRETNQDRVFLGGSFAAVADGAGGHRGGAMAAAMAIAKLADAAEPIGPGALVDLVERANRAVWAKAIEPRYFEMCTTVVALALRPDQEAIQVVNVGDSRAYQLRDGVLSQLTSDHSLVQDLVRKNELTPEEALTHAQRNIITRAVGTAPHVVVDQFLIRAVVGDRFLLCSDGLVNEITDNEIAQILSGWPEKPDRAACALVNTALCGDAFDNVTVAVLDVVVEAGSWTSADTVAVG
jgi:protein phosphatase